MATERGVIALICAQKGGTGKTTLATNIAVYMAEMGHDVLLMDADPQRNAANWAARRDALIENGEKIPTVHCVEKLGNIKQAALDASERYEAVIIDAGGRDSKSMRTGLSACDVAYIPSQASAFDLETMIHMEDVLDETADLNPTRTVCSIITMAPTNPTMRDAQEAREFLKDFHKSMPLSKNMVRMRKAYKKAAIAGLGVVEMDDAKAKAEMQLVTQELIKFATS